ncbi:uncharacterized protein PRCAT00002999001 [Priceomyces carsonii]|uniref:uncharacterized protein n=1 Tax=Priceomyces carsonii TaxID=28549 RepID=UPI002ED99EE0|nr:unnamed protein product [Priceomyces carsonii]
MDEKIEDKVHLRPKRSNKLKTFIKVFILVVLSVKLYFGASNYYFADTEIDPKAALLDALEINLASDWSKKYTSEAHLPGTNYGLVEWTKDKFEEYGFTATIDTYDIFVSYPKDHDLNLIDAKTEKLLYKAPLKEDKIKEDETSYGEGLVPTFLAYAANGNVTAQYVYVNYGTLEDFENLKSHGVDVKGKIAVARYGKIFRGLKVKFAQDNGAVGVLLYTDPGDDFGITPENGYKQYPDGPARQESSVQRGSVQFLGAPNSAPGDPTTPGYASKPGVERKSPYDSIGKIPALPISYREVKPILEKLNGHGSQIKDGWKGSLDGFDYSTGPNKNVTLNLYNNQVFNITPLWNVYGEIEGENKDEVIVIGNHRDAWIKGGAGDPNSGSAALIELARALGTLKASGYKFKRSIVLQSFDGEEYGLLGSTEQGEYFAKDLSRKVIAYLNLDSAVVGRFLSLSASPVLNELLLETAKELQYPKKGSGSLYDHFVKETKGKISILGSGSDYTVYLEHLGIPSADIGFGPGKGDSIYQYHSNYDSYYWMSKFGDPGFVYHNLAAKYLGLVVLGLDSKAVIPLTLDDYASSLQVYYNETLSIIPKDWLHQTVSNQQVWKDILTYSVDEIAFIDESSNGYYSSVPRFPFPELMETQTCKHNKVLHMFDVAHHKNATLAELLSSTKNDLLLLKNSTEAFDIKSKALQLEYDNRDSLHWWQRIRLYVQIKHHNKLIQYFERNFLHHKGLYERPWFKHIVFASGRKTGYAGQSLPGLKEAAEDENLDRFVEWLGIVSKSVRRVSARLAFQANLVVGILGCF